MKMSKCYFYATEEAFKWLDNSTMTTMWDLYRISHSLKRTTPGYAYMNNLKVVGSHPNYIFKEKNEIVTVNDYVHYLGYYDTDLNKGRNDMDLLKVMEVMYGTLPRSW